MIKNLFSVAAALLFAVAMNSCASSDTDDAPQSSDEIKFSLTSNPLSRAADVYCNANLPASFRLWANSTGSGAAYIVDETYTRDGSLWSSPSAHYWPTQTLDLYAIAGDANHADFSATPSVSGFEAVADVASQTDLIYAVKSGASKPASATPIELNFRHALSQVVFRGKNLNSNIYVEISAVGIRNLHNSGDFQLPSVSTDGNIEDHTGNGSFIDTGRGTWTLSDSKADYLVTLPATVELPGASDALSVSLTDKTEAEGFNLAMMLLPQTLEAWDATGPLLATDGVAIVLTCKIWNVSGSAVDKGSDVVIYDGNIALPLAIAWEGGRRYIYTIVFDKNGHGGFDPDPEDPDPDTPIPPLSPLTSVLRLTTS